MAVEVEMNDDVRKYETKTFGPFTTRQMVCILIAMSYSIPIGIFAPLALDNKILLIIVVALPVLLAGYIQIDGTTFEVLLLRILYWKILAPGRRRYKMHNTFREALNRMNDSQERRYISRMSEKDRKEYLKKKKAKKVIKYSKNRKYKVYV